MTLPEPGISSTSLAFDPGLRIRFDTSAMDFAYGDGLFGPRPEYRRLDAIRESLRDPNCNGPETVYAIAMDVGRVGDLAELKRRMLLFGIVMYAGGRLGDEPVRSQGHVHAVSPHSGWRASTGRKSPETIPVVASPSKPGRATR